jgi:glycosyltransferase involved in cell wall biosynthesis
MFPKVHGSILDLLAVPASLDEGNTPYVGMLHLGLRQSGFAVAGWRSVGLHQSADILQVHWPEAVFWNRLSTLHPRGARLAADRLLATARRIRAAGGAVIWTIHDLRPHDGIAPALIASWRHFFPAFLDQVDAVISLSRTALDQVHAAFPVLRSKPSLVAPHPHVRGAFAAPHPPEAARRQLGLAPDSPVFCSVGQMRPYKALPALIRAFAAAGTGGVLIVAGQCRDPALADDLRAAANAAGPAVRLEPRLLSDDEVGLIHAAADIAVFNFAAILNSGSAMTALSLNRPVLAPALGSLVELAAAVGPDWMRLADRLTPEVLLEAAAWAHAARGQRPDLSAFDPEAVVQQHVVFYRSLLASRQPVPRRA